METLGCLSFVKRIHLLCSYVTCFQRNVASPRLYNRRMSFHLSLSLPLQVHHTHVHDGPQVGEGLHHPHVGAQVVAVHVELEEGTNDELRGSTAGSRCVNTVV